MILSFNLFFFALSNVNSPWFFQYSFDMSDKEIFERTRSTHLLAQGVNNSFSVPGGTALVLDPRPFGRQGFGSSRVKEKKLFFEQNNFSLDPSK